MKMDSQILYTRINKLIKKILLKIFHVMLTIGFIYSNKENQSHNVFQKKE